MSNRKPRSRKTHQKNVKGMYGEKKPTQEEVKLAKEKVKEGAVVVHNRVGETDSKARERVGTSHPGKDLVDETKTGVLENSQPNEVRDNAALPNEKINLEEKKVKQKFVPEVRVEKSSTEMAEQKRVEELKMVGNPGLEVKSNSDGGSDVIHGQAYYSGLFGNANVTPLPYPVSKSVVSNFKPSWTEKFKVASVTWEGPVIGDFQTLKEYKLERVKLIENIEREYFHIFMSMPTQMNSVTRRHKCLLDGAYGMDIDPFVKNSVIDASGEYAAIYARLISRTADQDPFKVKELHDCITSPPEAWIQKRAHERAQSLDIGVEPFVDYFKLISNPHKVFRDPVDVLGLTKEMFIGMFPWRMDLYDKYLRHKPNILLRKELYDVTRTWVNSMTTVESAGVSNVMSTLYALAGVQTNVFSEAPAVAGQLDTTKGRDFLITLITCYLLGDLVEIEIEGFDDRSIGAAISCFLWHLIPASLMSDVSRKNVNNNLLKHFFLQRRKASDPRGIKVKPLQSLGEDYLTEYLNSGIIPQGAALSPFLSSHGYFGWGTAGKNIVTPLRTVLPPKGQRLAQSDRVALSWNFFGDEPNGIPTAVTYLVQAMEGVSRINDFTLSRTSITAIEKWTEYLGSQRFDYTEMVPSLQEFITSLGILPIVSPNSSLRKIANPLKIYVDLTSILSFFGTVTIDKGILNNTPTGSDVFSAWSRHVTCNQLAYWISLYKRYVDKAYVRSSELFGLAIERLPDSPLKGVFKQIADSDSFGNLFNKVTFDDVPDFMKAGLNDIEMFINEMKQYLGFTDRVYFCPDLNVKGTYGSRYLERWFYDNQRPVVKNYNLMTIQDYTKLPEIAKIIRKSLREGKAVSISLPVKVHVVEMKQGNEFMVESAAFSLTNQNEIVMKPVKVYYIKGDKYVDFNNYQFLAIIEPRVGVNFFPIKDMHPGILMTWLQTVPALRRGLRNVEPDMFNYVIVESM
jgi:hypothetical protein